MPENLQERNVRRFKGFTPQQVQKLLEGKGLKPNSREAAEYLGAMANKAEDLLQRSKANTMHQGQGFQMGGQVGGFDPQSQKLFDAAVKRVSSNQPQTPEVQRYLDNVIETRGRPTMVFPHTADPLQDAMPQQGYQQGGLTPPTTSPPLPTGDIGIPSFGNRRDPLPPTTTPGSAADALSRLPYILHCFFASSSSFSKYAIQSGILSRFLLTSLYQLIIFAVSV